MLKQGFTDKSPNITILPPVGCLPLNVEKMQALCSPVMSVYDWVISLIHLASMQPLYASLTCPGVVKTNRASGSDKETTVPFLPIPTGAPYFWPALTCKYRVLSERRDAQTTNTR
jgi:hypothetical protein